MSVGGVFPACTQHVCPSSVSFGTFSGKLLGPRHSNKLKPAASASNLCLNPSAGAIGSIELVANSANNRRQPTPCLLGSQRQSWFSKPTLRRWTTSATFACVSGRVGCGRRAGSAHAWAAAASSLAVDVQSACRPVESAPGFPQRMPCCPMHLRVCEGPTFRLIRSFHPFSNAQHIAVPGVSRASVHSALSHAQSGGRHWPPHLALPARHLRATHTLSSGRLANRSFAHHAVKRGHGSAVFLRVSGHRRLLRAAIIPRRCRQSTAQSSLQGLWEMTCAVCPLC